jgi:molecular chaperone GrpE (heat shock protein)
MSTPDLKRDIEAVLVSLQALVEESPSPSRAEGVAQVARLGSLVQPLLEPQPRAPEATTTEESGASASRHGVGHAEATDEISTRLVEVLNQILAALEALRSLTAELEKVDARRLVDTVTELSASLTAVRTRQEDRAVRGAVMAFSPLAHDIDELASDRNPVLSDAALVLQEKLERAFAANGVIRFVPRVGQPFDKDRHKAIESLTTSAPDQDRVIAEVHRRGYEHGGQLLSPAVVTIYKIEA